MDRKGIIAVALSILTLIAWYYYNTIEMKKVAAARAQEEVVAAAQAPQPVAATPTAAAPSAAPVPAPAPGEPTVPEQIEVLPTATVDYTFSNLGGGIAKALLKNHEGERGTKMALNEFG